MSKKRADHEKVFNMMWTGIGRIQDKIKRECHEQITPEDINAMIGAMSSCLVTLVAGACCEEFPPRVLFEEYVNNILDQVKKDLSDWNRQCAERN